MTWRQTTARRGLSESVQWALLGTALLACLLGLIEGGLVLHGRAGVAAAALAGAQAQAALQAEAGAGRQAADQTARQAGLTVDSIVVSVSTVDVTVTVEARVPTFIGWYSPLVSASATRPVEGQ